MKETSLPAGFEDLERFVTKWAKPTQSARSAVRQSSGMSEIREFYDALLPRLDDILVHMDKFPYDHRFLSLPDDSRRLYYLALSLAEVATAVELFGQPSVPYGYDPAKFRPTHEEVE